VSRGTGVPVRDALDSALVALEAARVESPRLDAEVLLAHALGVDRAALWLDPDREVSGDASRWFREAIRRRTVERAPVAYIVGRKGFRHLDLEVDSRVLVPRPESEHLVEAVLDLPHSARVHDVGTGSGAIALAIAADRPDARVTATDSSADALALARENAERLGLEVELVQTNLLDGLPGPFDLVVSNPPYVRPGEQLQPELAFEPRAALVDAGQTQALIAAARDVLDGWLVLECHEDAAADVARACAGYADVAISRDLAGKDRVVEARWTR
jgi:release factor glutamine methyltransferase